MTTPTDQSASDRRIGWGILSTGHIASVIAEDLALLTDEAEFVAVGSRDLAKAESFASTYGAKRAYGTYAELAADPDVDVVYVASPHNDHFPSAKLCLEAGKSVLVEKPLTVTDAEAEELIALARDRKLFLMEALWSRTNPLLRQAAEMVKSGELGQVRHVAASFGFAFDGDESHRLLNPELAGGAILDLGVYPVHGVNLFLGEPESVLGYGSLASTGVDSHAAALLTYPATADRPAATAQVMCTLEATPATRLEIMCTEARVVINFFIKPDSVEIFRNGVDEKEPEVLVTQLPGNGYTLQVQEVNRALRDGDLESPLVPWDDTLATMRTLNKWRSEVERATASGQA